MMINAGSGRTMRAWPLCPVLFFPLDPLSCPIIIDVNLPSSAENSRRIESQVCLPPPPHHHQRSKGSSSGMNQGPPRRRRRLRVTNWGIGESLSCMR